MSRTPKREFQVFTHCKPRLISLVQSELFRLGYQWRCEHQDVLNIKSAHVFYALADGTIQWDFADLYQPGNYETVTIDELLRMESGDNHAQVLADELAVLVGNKLADYQQEHGVYVTECCLEFNPEPWCDKSMKDDAFSLNFNVEVSDG